ncbi:MAG: hypothetical protein KAG14_00810 [Mycoplasmataceae bacterium]|nr:hypothetical protein [Mycoplasmataceae bacterium]
MNSAIDKAQLTSDIELLVTSENKGSEITNIFTKIDAYNATATIASFNNRYHDLISGIDFRATTSHAQASGLYSDKDMTSLNKCVVLPHGIANLRFFWWTSS